MQRAELWSSETIDRAGERHSATASVAEKTDGVFVVEFRGVASQPKHASLRWNGAPIVAAIDLVAGDSKLSYNPGSIEWRAASCTLRFVANAAEIEAVCARHDAESNKLEPEP